MRPKSTALLCEDTMGASSFSVEKIIKVIKYLKKNSKIKNKQSVVGQMLNTGGEISFQQL